MGGTGVYRPAIRPGDHANTCDSGESHEGIALTHLHIVPDRRVANDDVTDLLRALTTMYRRPIDRLFESPYRAGWEIMLSRGGADFYLTVPDPFVSVTSKQTAVVWPRATVQPAPDPLATFTPDAVARLELKEHFIFPLRVDRRTLGILPSLLETMKMIGDDQQVAIQIILEPAAPDWWESASAAYEELRAGKIPKRLEVSGKGVARAGLKAAAYVVMECIGIVEELFTGEPPEPVNLEPDIIHAIRERPRTSYNVASKLKNDAFDVTVRVAIAGANGPEADALMRSIWYAFRTLDGENAWMLRQESAEKGADRMRRRAPGFKANRDYLSIPEATMMVQLPTGPLQKEYKLTAIDHRETDLPAIITRGGLLFGHATHQGKEFPVYIPTGDHDELCLPRVVVGGMGTGKTTFGANLVVEAARAGFGAVVIDPAIGQIGDEVEATLGPEKVMRIRFGESPIALDWREARHSKRAANRLANEIITFFESATDEAGAQTIRYLRAAAKAAPSGRLSEVVRLLTDAEYREAAGLDLFDRLSAARQTTVAEPILNRLDVVMGDDYLAECMEAEEGLDFVELLETPRAVILDIPKGTLGSEAVDVLASLVITKLDLAMVLRRSRHPVFIVQDEPHQYMRGARVWRSATVESRKWRFAYCWLFHDFVQIPRDVATLIMSAGAHFHLYTSSKATYRALAEEIAPFTIEEAMETPRHWALNVIRAGGRTVEPFLAKTLAPPTTSRVK